MQKSFTTLQKHTFAIQQLAYGNMTYMLDEYLNMSERTSREKPLLLICYYQPRWGWIFVQTNIQRHSNFVCCTRN